MESFFSSIANCRVRWLDLPGTGTPLVFVHGLGCASSYEYPRVVTDKNFTQVRSIDIMTEVISDSDHSMSWETLRH